MARKRKHPRHHHSSLPPQSTSHIHDSDSDIDINEDDIAFVRAITAGSNFLGVDLERVSVHHPKEKKQKVTSDSGIPSKSVDEEDTLAQYELESRDFSDDEPGTLPVKTDRGWVRELNASVSESDDDGDDDKEGGDRIQNDDNDDEEENEIPNELHLEMKEAQSDRKQGRGNEVDVNGKNVLSMISELASEISSDPESHMGNFKVLRKYATSKKMQVVKVALVSQVAVFKDIIPGYMIRELTDAEKKTKLSKEVKKQRDYESSLLSHYQSFLSLLDSLSRLSSSSSSLDTPPTSSTYTESESFSIRHTAIRCLCLLLSSCTHFNFSLNITTALIKFHVSNYKSPHVLLRSSCSLIIETIQGVLSKMNGSGSGADGGRTMMEVVKLIADVVKVRGFRVGSGLLDTFLALKLTTSLASQNENGKEGRKKKEVHVSKRNRKYLKEERKLEDELKKAEQVVDAEQKEKFQTETLKYVFTTYIRILKSAPTSPLLSSIMKGLKKFGHLVNVEYFQSLLALIKTILTDHIEELTNEEVWLCIDTAFSLVSGQGEALNIDMKLFYDIAYHILLRLSSLSSTSTSSTSSFTSSDQDAISIASTLQSLFSPRHALSLPPPRIAGFLSRLFTIASTSFSPSSCLSILESCRRVLLKSPPRVFGIFDSASSSSSSTSGSLKSWIKSIGQSPDSDDSLSAVPWDLSLLTGHWHPHVRTYVTKTKFGENQYEQQPNGIMMTMSIEDVERVYAWDRGTKYFPHFQTLAPSVSRNNRKRQVKECGDGYLGSREVKDAVNRDMDVPNFASLKNQMNEAKVRKQKLMGDVNAYQSKMTMYLTYKKSKK